MRHTPFLICLCLIAASVTAQNINIPAEITDATAWPRAMPRLLNWPRFFGHNLLRACTATRLQASR